MTTQRKPAYIAYAVNGEGKQAFWTRIGTAWPQTKGEGFNIDLTAFPVNGRIILMPPKAEQGADEEVAS
jgi:hypothetical protein